MAMPLSLSANTSTSSGATGGYSNAHGTFSGENITNVSPDSASNVLYALTGPQSEVSPFTGAWGSTGVPASQSAAAVSASVGANGASVTLTPTLLIGGLAAIAFLLWRR